MIVITLSIYLPNGLDMMQKKKNTLIFFSQHE